MLLVKRKIFNTEISSNIYMPHNINTLNWCILIKIYDGFDILQLNSVKQIIEDIKKKKRRENFNYVRKS